MKATILLAAILLCISFTTKAQIDRGKIQVGGSIGGLHQTYDGNSFNPAYEASNLFVTPSIGFFYKPNQLAGLYLDFGYSENTSNGYTRSRNYGGGLFFRQYKPVLPKLYVFLDERGGYNYYNGDGNVYSSHSYSLNASFETGMAYGITRHMQLELSLNNLAYASYNNANNTRGYSVGTSLEKNVFSNIGFGFRYYLK